MPKQVNTEPSGKSGRPRSFFSIKDNGDGTGDIYFDRCEGLRDADEQNAVHDTFCRVLKGVQLFDGIEDDIRERFESWYKSAEVIVL